MRREERIEQRRSERAVVTPVSGGIFSPPPSAWTDGALVTLSGSGFGSKAQAAPVVFDRLDETWENGVDTNRNAGLGEGDPIPSTLWRPIADGGGSHQVDSSTVRNRPLSYRFNCGPNAGVTTTFYGLTNGTGEAFTALGWTGKSSIYLRWYTRLDTALDSGVSTKYVRIWDTYSGGSAGALQLTWSHIELTNISCFPSPAGGTSYLNPGAWYLMELWLKPFLYTTWIDNVPRAGNTQTSCASWTTAWLRGFGMEASRGATHRQNTQFWMSDVWVDDSPKRIEIADVGTGLYDATIREPCLATSWSDGQLTFRVNQGALDANFTNKHLYVMNDDNSQNAAYDLSLVA